MKKALQQISYLLVIGMCSLTAHAQTITTFAGNGVLGYGGDNGSAMSASINNPFSMAVDNEGSVYIADQNNHRIRKVDTFGTITLIAGTGVGGYDGDGAPATSKELFFPAGIAVDSSGNVYIADYGNDRVRKITKSTGLISTIAGTSSAGYSGDGGAATAAKIFNPYGLAIDTARNIYFADRSNHRIRKISNTGIITTIAGTGVSGFSGDGGQATAARIKYPIGVTLDTFGNVYFSDWGNNRVRKITKTTGVITTIAGTGTAGFSGDGGAATLAQLNQPYSVSVDESGKVYIAEFSNTRVRRIDSLGIISTFAGNGAKKYSGDWGPATAASLIEPSGVTVDRFRNVYIADHYNNRIRVVYAGGVISGSRAVCEGFTTALTDAAGGGAGTWRSSMTSVATVGSSTGLVTGVAAGTTSITYEAPAYYGYQFSVVTVTVNPLPSSISGATSICTGGTGTLTNSGGGTWTSSATTTATIGLSTGILSGKTVGTLTITYTLGTGCKTTATITVNPSPASISGVSSICTSATTLLLDATSGGAWSSGTIAVATIDPITHIVTGVSAGSATISYILGTGCYATKKVTVTDCGSMPIKINSGGWPNGDPVSSQENSANTGADNVQNTLVSQPGLHVYPNPSQGTFTMTFSSAGNEEAVVTITNILGQKVKEWSVAVSKSTPATITAHQPPGIYLVTVLTASDKYFARVLVNQ